MSLTRGLRRNFADNHESLPEALSNVEPAAYVERQEEQFCLNVISVYAIMLHW